MATIPDADEFRRRWAGLAAADRRRVLRAVNAGRAVEARREAPLAVALARRQQRFWRVAGVVAPIVGLVAALLTSRGDATVPVLLANAAVGAVGVGLVALFWFRRAARSEQANLDRLGRRR